MKDCEYMRQFVIKIHDTRKDRIDETAMFYCTADFDCDYKASGLRFVKKSEGIDNPVCMLNRLRKYQR